MSGEINTLVVIGVWVHYLLDIPTATGVLALPVEEIRLLVHLLQSLHFFERLARVQVGADHVLVPNVIPRHGFPQEHDELQILGIFLLLVVRFLDPFPHIGDVDHRCPVHVLGFRRTFHAFLVGELLSVPIDAAAKVFVVVEEVRFLVLPATQVGMLKHQLQQGHAPTFLCPDDEHRWKRTRVIPAQRACRISSGTRVHPPDIFCQ